MQGLPGTLDKLHDVIRAMSGIHEPSANDIVPIISSLASKVCYRTYIDIGATTGDTTIPVASLFERCIAIEPLTTNYDTLIINLRRHKIENVLCERCAVGLEQGYKQLYISKIRPDLGSLAMQQGLNETVDVPVKTLEQIVNSNDVKPPFLIKCDVQGLEPHIVKGSKEFFTRSGITFISEFWPFGITKSGEDPIMYILMMRRLGYEVYNLRGLKIPNVNLIAFCKISQIFSELSTDIVFSNMHLD